MRAAAQAFLEGDCGAPMSLSFVMARLKISSRPATRAMTMILKIAGLAM